MHWDSRWLWQGNTRDKQVWWWMNLTARWMVAAEVDLPDVKKVDVTSFYPCVNKCFFGGRWWRRWMSHLGNAIGYHGIVEKRHCRNNWWLSVPRSNGHPKQHSRQNWRSEWQCKHMSKSETGSKWLACMVYAIWHGRHKELWIKGAAGSVDQQAVERHW